MKFIFQQPIFPHYYGFNIWQKNVVNIAYIHNAKNDRWQACPKLHTAFDINETLSTVKVLHVYGMSKPLESLCKMHGRTMPLFRHLQESPVLGTFPALPFRTRMRAVGSGALGTWGHNSIPVLPKQRNYRVAHTWVLLSYVNCGLWS